MRHTHRAIRCHVTPFRGPVPGAKPNPKAHGAFRCVESCRCGAQRTSNYNGTEREEGPWVGGDA